MKGDEVGKANRKAWEKAFGKEITVAYENGYKVLDASGRPMEPHLEKIVLQNVAFTKKGRGPIPTGNLAKSGILVRTKGI